MCTLTQYTWHQHLHRLFSHTICYSTQSWTENRDKSNGDHCNAWLPIYPIKFKTLGWGPPEVLPLTTELWLPANLLVKNNFQTISHHPKTYDHTHWSLFQLPHLRRCGYIWWACRCGNHWITGCHLRWVLIIAQFKATLKLNQLAHKVEVRRDGGSHVLQVLVCSVCWHTVELHQVCYRYGNRAGYSSHTVDKHHLVVGSCLLYSTMIYTWQYICVVAL